MTLQALIFDRDAHAYAERLGAQLPEVRFIAAPTEDDAVAQGAEADVLLGLAPFITPRLIGALPKLRWIQALTTGTDNLLYDMPNLDPGVLISSMRGIHGPQMAELAFVYMLSLSRDLRGLFAQQTAARWVRSPQRLLWGRHAVLVGVGTISGELAARCKAFGMKVTGVSSSAREVPGFDQVVARGDLAKVAAEADFLIVLLPYDESTHHVIGAEVIGAMKPDAVLVNISRGRVVDEDALLQALEAGSIRAAGLDVFETEPLPAESRFWSHPRVMVTPHIGGMSDIYVDQAIPTVVENFRAYLANDLDRMHNIVRRETTHEPDSH